MARRGRNPNLFIRLRIKDSIENRTREGGTQAPFIMGTKGAHSIRRWYNNPPFFNSFTVDEDTGVIGSTFQFDISASDFDGDVLSYSWSISGPGSPSLSLSNANKRAIFTAAERGDYTITVSVSDGIQTISQTKTVSVLNRAPTQNTFTIDKTSGYVGDSFVLTMVSNTDPDGDPVTITWSGISSDQISVENPSLISSVATVTPTSAGTFTITATIADNQGGSNTYSKTFTVAVNSAPTLTLGLNRFTGNVSNTFTAYAITSDPEGDSLTYRWFLNGVEQTGETGDSFSVRPGVRGSYTVRVVVSDGYNEVEDEDSFEIINRVPSLSAITISPATTGNQDTVFTASVTGTDPDSADSDDVITYSWSIDSPGGSLSDPATLTGSGNTVTFNPPDGTYGEYTIYVSGSDQYGGTSSTQEATITVANRLPEISTLTVTPETGSYGNNSSDDFTFEVTTPSPDLDGHPVTVSWSFGDISIEENYTNLSDGVLTSRAIISGSTLVAAGAGTYSMRVTLDDGQVDHDGTTTQDISFELEQKPVPPVSLTLNQSSGFNDDTFAITASHDDYADIAGLTYTWSLDGVEQEETGSVLSVGSPSRGTHTVVVTVRDEGGYNETGESTTFEVVNKVPSLSAITISPATTGNQDTVFTASVTVSNLDSDDVITYSWSFTGAPGGSSPVFVGTGNSVTFDPPDRIFGDYTLSVVANDQFGGTSSPSTVTVTVENRAPTISSFTVNGSDSASGYITDTFDFTASASDPDGGTLNYVWHSDISSSTFTTGSGGRAATYHPRGTMLTGGYRGPHVITVIVSDDPGGAEVTSSALTVDITDRAPTASFTYSGTTNTGETITLDAAGSSDPDGDTVEYVWSFFSKPASSTATFTTAAATATFPADVAGDYTVRLTVRSGTPPMSDSEDVTITITELTNYPAVTIIPTMSTDPGDGSFVPEWPVSISGSATDSDGNSINFDGATWNWSLSGPDGHNCYLDPPDVDSEGSPILGTVANTPEVSFIFDNATTGSYTVSLYVNTATETGDTETYTFTVNTLPPSGP